MGHQAPSQIRNTPYMAVFRSLPTDLLFALRSIASNYDPLQKYYVPE
jgi:hypothetical protein